MKRTLAAFIYILLIGITTSAFAGPWQLDAAHSLIGFSVRHLGISNVSGKFSDYTGTVQADDQSGKITEVVGTVKATSINTDNEKRDNHLRSADFFDVEKFPEITTRTHSITWDGNKFTAICDLTMKGVTKSVRATGEMTGVETLKYGPTLQRRAGYTLSAKINRFDFGLNWSKTTEAIAIVGDTVTINIDAEIFRPIQ